MHAYCKKGLGASRVCTFCHRMDCVLWGEGNKKVISWGCGCGEQQGFGCKGASCQHAFKTLKCRQAFI